MPADDYADPKKVIENEKNVVNMEDKILLNQPSIP